MGCMGLAVEMSVYACPQGGWHEHACMRQCSMPGSCVWSHTCHARVPLDGDDVRERWTGGAHPVPLQELDLLYRPWLSRVKNSGDSWVEGQLSAQRQHRRIHT